ncbi:hypothetical protein BC936DRAFT_148235 [Jimgerdemannia flammicorona]|uniref:Uncharacterized protein n=1 Tax=Jimgerdemannia flammicorona TaxID=994334 RepID=A0A433DKV5_9FUNG|nr:hypothetical protein BC936DRAFT_148235 [Jimgerdemannia flammicorona]
MYGFTKILNDGSQEGIPKFSIYSCLNFKHDQQHLLHLIKQKVPEPKDNEPGVNTVIRKQISDIQVQQEIMASNIQDFAPKILSQSQTLEKIQK